MPLGIAKHKECCPHLSNKGFIAWKEITLKRFAGQTGYGGERMSFQDDAVPERTNEIFI